MTLLVKKFGGTSVGDIKKIQNIATNIGQSKEACLLYTSPSPRDPKSSRMPSSA